MCDSTIINISNLSLKLKYSLLLLTISTILVKDKWRSRSGVNTAVYEGILCVSMEIQCTFILSKDIKDIVIAAIEIWNWIGPDTTWGNMTPYMNPI